MFGTRARKIVTPVKQLDPSTAIRDHVVKNSNAPNILVSEYDIVDKEKPIPFWMRDFIVPRWLLLTFVSLAIVVFTAFALFASIVTLKKETYGGACKSNSDCRRDVGLICNNYRCGCAYSHFWSETYRVCERRRMINRTCVNDSMCDTFANLQCRNVSLSNGNVELQCQCKASMTYAGSSCDYQRIYNGSCGVDSDCDNTRYLYCNTTLGLCRCNSSMFWNGNPTSGTCEYKRTIGQYCYPYDTNWCDDVAPVGQRLICARYVNPYGSEYGVCQCDQFQYYNGTVSLANGYCVPRRLYNQSCTSTNDCDFRLNLVCTSNLCVCSATRNYDPTVTISGLGVVGYCKAVAGYHENCTTGFLCSSVLNLYCDFSVSGGSNVYGICECNSSISYWDGTTCISKLSIGGDCTSHTNCRAIDGLFCSNYSQSVGTCDCDKNHYWNETCMLKKWYNISCASSYECDDNRGLHCQGLGTNMFLKCDCYNASFIWDSLYVNNRSYTCIPRLTYGQQTCFGDLECEDFNYLKCNNGTCGCNYTDYWDGTRCQLKKNYEILCGNTTECRDYNPVNLVCRTGTTVPPALQCLCDPAAYWSNCTQTCIVSKQIHQPCILVANCTTNECDQTKNLQCMNDTVTNVTGSGWCNCTSLQWWNGTYCRNKGTPSWGNNGSALCNSTYQCADYNLVSCPLGSSSVTSVATCECATTKYWDGFTCLDRVFFGASCTRWPTNPVNTSTCLSAAGAGLMCTSNSCVGGNCTGGTCVCPSGTNWNPTFLICASASSG